MTKKPLASDESLDLTSAEMQEGSRITKRTWILLAAALFCLLLSVFLGTPIKNIFRNPEQIWADGADVARELGFAFGIAFIVILAVETASRREFNQTIHERIRKIQRNVFAATFQRHIPLEVIAEVNELVFNTYFIRVRQSIRYSLKVMDISEVKPELSGKRVVQMDYASSSIVRNIGSTIQPFPITLTTEQPSMKRLEDRAWVKLNRVEMAGEDLDLCKLLKGCQEKTKSLSCTIENVEPDACIRIEASARTYKLLTDYEIWTCLYPTTDFEVVIQLSHPTEVFGAKAMHRVPLRQRIIDEHCRAYQVRGAMLPHQGVLFWWCFDPDMLTPTTADCDHKAVLVTDNKQLEQVS